MKSYRKELKFHTKTRRAYVNITPQVETALAESGIREGLCLVNAMNITASVFINDNESGLHRDFERWLEKLAPGETIDVEAAAKSLPDIEPKKIRFQCESDEYIFNQPANIQVLLLEVRAIIRKALPDAAEKMAWQMPTYWQGQNLIHFAAQKNHLGIYPGVEAMEYFAPRLSGYKTSKGAIQFPYKAFGKEQYELISEIAAWCGKERAKT